MKYKATCEHCGKDTAIAYEEWLNLTQLMLTFSGLTPSQKETIMLITDGMKYRQLINASPPAPTHKESEK